MCGTFRISALICLIYSLYETKETHSNHSGGDTAGRGKSRHYPDIPSEEIPLIEADKTLLNRALQNLIENAVHYTGSGGTIRVSLALQNNSVLFIVKDSGIGIAPIDQQRVFERFYRVQGFDTAKEKGSGLGLAIVKSIAEKHGGTVKVESQLGLGSTFYLSIPIREKEQGFTV